MKQTLTLKQYWFILAAALVVATVIPNYTIYLLNKHQEIANIKHALKTNFDIYIYEFSIDIDHNDFESVTSRLETKVSLNPLIRSMSIALNDRIIFSTQPEYRGQNYADHDIISLRNLLDKNHDRFDMLIHSDLSASTGVDYYSILIEPDPYIIAERINTRVTAHIITSIITVCSVLAVFLLFSKNYITDPIKNLSRKISRGVFVESNYKLAEIREFDRTILDSIRATQANNTLLESVLNNTGDLIYYKDEQLKFIGCNQAFADFAGMKPEAITGCDHQAVFSDGSIDWFLEAEQIALHTHRIQTNYGAISGDQPLYFQTQKIPFKYAEGKIGIISISRDVTELYKTQQVVEEKAWAEAKARDAAERALEDLTTAQDHMVQAEKMAALGGLVAGVAHEINTPIGVSLSAATHINERTLITLQQYQAEDLSEEQLNEYFEAARKAGLIITSNMLRAAELINSFKNIAVDQTQIYLRQFNVRSYLHEIIISLEPRLKKFNITLDIDCPDDITMFSYPGPLSQLFTNLIENSLHHAFTRDDEGCISIKVEADKTGMICFRYKDNGAGMPTDVQKKAFDPFFTTRRGRGGSGLGLHIVHNIATQSLGGHISMTSTPGEGTEFLIHVPAILESAEAGQEYQHA